MNDTLAVAGGVALVVLLTAFIILLVRDFRYEEQNAKVAESVATFVQVWVFDAHPLRTEPDPMRDRARRKR